MTAKRSLRRLLGRGQWASEPSPVPEGLSGRRPMPSYSECPDCHHVDQGLRSAFTGEPFCFHVEEDRDWCTCQNSFHAVDIQHANV